MKTDDGGTAFPVPGERDPITGAGIHEGSRGMSLRDWFAGQALTGRISTGHGSVTDASIHARICYQLADAMLAARKGNP